MNTEPLLQCSKPPVEKHCKRCGATKSSNAFGVVKSTKDGLSPYCKHCTREYANRHYAKSRAEKPGQVEKIREANRQSYYRQRANMSLEKLEAKRADSRERNRANKAKSSSRKYPRSAEQKLLKRIRKATKRQAMPKWVDRCALVTMYKKRLELSEKYGIEFHVDHVVPLNSELVCGLHVPANLQLLAAELNIQKSNAEWPDMP